MSVRYVSFSTIVRPDPIRPARGTRIKIKITKYHTSTKLKFISSRKPTRSSQYNRQRHVHIHTRINRKRKEGEINQAYEDINTCTPPARSSLTTLEYHETVPEYRYVHVPSPNPHHHHPQHTSPCQPGSTGPSLLPCTDSTRAGGQTTRTFPPS